ncbi:MAG: hypothetical protein D4R96_03400, partial [Nitrosopumilaceae archaeon]
YKDKTTTILEWDNALLIVNQRLLEMKADIALHSVINRINIIPMPVPMNLPEEEPEPIVSPKTHQHYS